MSEGVCVSHAVESTPPGVVEVQLLEEVVLAAGSVVELAPGTEDARVVGGAWLAATLVEVTFDPEGLDVVVVELAVGWCFFAAEGDDAHADSTNASRRTAVAAVAECSQPTGGPSTPLVATESPTLPSDTESHPVPRPWRPEARPGAILQVF